MRSYLLLLFMVMTGLCCQAQQKLPASAAGSKAVAAIEKADQLLIGFGNSTTAPRKGVDSVYLVRLSALLSQNSEQSFRIINDGIRGSHTGFLTDNARFKVPHGRDRFEQLLQKKPDWVVICFGINDCWVDDGDSTKSGRIPLPDYERNISFFVKALQETGCRVILMSPNPVGAKYERWRKDRLYKYVQADSTIARQFNALFINLHAVYDEFIQRHQLTVDDLLLDGVHPNDRGHELMAEAMFEAMKPFLSPSKSK